MPGTDLAAGVATLAGHEGWFAVVSVEAFTDGGDGVVGQVEEQGADIGRDVKESCQTWSSVMKVRRSGAGPCRGPPGGGGRRPEHRPLIERRRPLPPEQWGHRSTKSGQC